MPTEPFVFKRILCMILNQFCRAVDFTLHPYYNISGYISTGVLQTTGVLQVYYRCSVGNVIGLNKTVSVYGAYIDLHATLSYVIVWTMFY